MKEENTKINRIRAIFDNSQNIHTREGPPQLSLDHPEVKEAIERDMMFNVYRDGVWGTLRHLHIADGKLLFEVKSVIWKLIKTTTPKSDFHEVGNHDSRCRLY